MGLRDRYSRAKAKLLADSTFCESNRAVCAEFLAFQEYKLKRQNGLPDLDDGCFKTLYGYIQYLKNVNRWFENKPWRELTKADFQRVYDGLEDGTIINQRGGQVQNRVAYYNKIFKGKPFRMIGKDVLAREVIQFCIKRRPPVRFVTEDTFQRLVTAVSGARHLLLVWLAWDIGENIDTLLKLTGRNFIPQANGHTGEREYLIHLPSTKLKRSRTSRSEVTLYPETARYADYVLPTIGPDDLVFPFGYRQAAKFLASAVRKTGATTMPNSQPVRWKDLRSGMACHLLRSGWTRDEVNARLGHTPHSDALDAYVNFMALDRNASKQRLQGLRTPAPDWTLARPSFAGKTENLTLKRELLRAQADIEGLRSELRELLAMSRGKPLR